MGEPAKKIESSGLVVITRDELSELIRVSVTDAVNAALRKQAEPAEWMDVKEAAKLLGYVPNYLAQLVTRGTVPGHRYGRKLRFHRPELDAFIASREGTR